MKNILLISDVTIGDFNFIKFLRTQYKVDVVTYVSTALHRLRILGYDLVIVEVGKPLGFHPNSEALKDSKEGLNFYESHLKEFKVPAIFWSWTNDFKEELIPNEITFISRSKLDDHLLQAVIDSLEKE